MTEMVPTVDFSLVIRGKGTLLLGDLRIPIGSLRATREKYRYDLPWQIELRVSEEGRAALGWMMNALDDAQVEGTTDEGEPLYIPTFRWQRATGTLITGTAYEIREGIVPLPRVPDSLFITAYLTDNAIALPLADFLLPARDGSRKAEHPRRATCLTTTLGRLEFWLSRVHEKINIGSHEAQA